MFMESGKNDYVVNDVVHNSQNWAFFKPKGMSK